MTVLVGLLSVSRRKIRKFLDAFTYSLRWSTPRLSWAHCRKLARAVGCQTVQYRRILSLRKLVLGQLVWLQHQVQGLGENWSSNRPAQHSPAPQVAEKDRNHFEFT